MPSIKVMNLVSGDQRRDELWTCIGHFNLKAWSVQEAQGVMYIVTEEAELENYFVNSVINHFWLKGFDLLAPSELGSLSSVVVRQIEPSYKNKSTEEIINSIGQQNQWTSVDEVVFLPCQSEQVMIKIKFQTRKQAQRALHEGVKIFDQFIPPKNIEQEVYTRITSCIKCHSYSHTKNKCSKTVSKSCIKCGEEGHERADCRAGAGRLHCMTCGRNDHQTYDKGCPSRLKTLKDRSRMEKKKEKDKAMSRHRKYLDRQREYQAEAGDQKSNITPLPAGAMAIIMTAIVSALAMEKKKKGTFQNTLDSIYIYNNVPKVAMPPNIIEELIGEETAETIRGNNNNIDTEEEMDDNCTIPDDSVDFSRTAMLDRAEYMVPPPSPTPSRVPTRTLTESMSLQDMGPKRDRSGSIHSESKIGPVKKPKNNVEEEVSGGSQDEEEEAEHSILRKIKEHNIRIFFPTTYMSRNFHYNRTHVLKTLLKTNMNMTYKKKDDSDPKKLLQQAMDMNLSPEYSVEFDALSPERYKQLSRGHWSVVGLDSE